MGIIDSLLKNKPLSPWQQSVVEEGRVCGECGSKANITAPATDSDSMVRLSCPNCGWSIYEFKPTEPIIINFADIKR